MTVSTALALGEPVVERLAQVDEVDVALGRPDRGGQSAGVAERLAGWVGGADALVKLSQRLRHRHEPEGDHVLVELADQGHDPVAVLLEQSFGHCRGLELLVVITCQAPGEGGEGDAVLKVQLERVPVQVQERQQERVPVRLALGGVGEALGGVGERVRQAHRGVGVPHDEAVVCCRRELGEQGPRPFCGRPGSTTPPPGPYPSRLRADLLGDRDLDDRRHAVGAVHPARGVAGVGLEARQAVELSPQRATHEHEPLGVEVA